MVWLKACPRCHGDLFLDNDHYGEFKSCIQCGYIADLGGGIPALKPPRLASRSEAAWMDLMTASAAD